VNGNRVRLQSIFQIIEKHGIGKVLGTDSVTIEEFDRRLLQEIIALASLDPLLGPEEEERKLC
jgi:hypothetical protein